MQGKGRAGNFRKTHLRDVPSGHAQGVQCFGCIEIQHIPKIVILKVFGRIKAAAYHQHISDAGLQCPPVAWYGFGFIVYAVFDFIFLTTFYKSGYKVGKSFIFAAIPMAFLMVVIEATSYIPTLVWMDSYQPEHLLIQLPILIVGFICYGVLVPLAYRISAKRFEKVDL